MTKKKKNDAAPVLNGHATRQLRALGHSLDPVLAIGKNGITETLVKETTRALLRHELIKVRVHGEAPVDRKNAATELATATNAALAQVLGRTFLLYKPHPDKPKIVLAKPQKAAPPAKSAKSTKGAYAKPRAETTAPLDHDDDGDGDGDGGGDDGEYEEPEE